MRLVLPFARLHANLSRLARHGPAEPAGAPGPRSDARRPIPGRRRMRKDAPPVDRARLDWALLAPALFALTLLTAGRPAAAEELDLGTNSAGIINFPTALDQRTPNLLQGAVELVDLATPDVRFANLRYGRQVGSLQLLADVYDSTEPAREFAYAEAKAKLRVISLDALHTEFAVGALARWTDQRSKDDTLLDNKPYSLLGVFTTELFPFEQWGAFLLNVYLDNRFADAGVKVQLYEGIRFVSETDYHIVDVKDDPHKWRFKAGLEFDGDRNFYAQILYDDIGNHARLQIGSGF